jgi:hypothetical protein
LDSGTTGMLMDKTFILNHKLTTTKLAKLIPVYNVDGSHNQGESIEEVNMIMYFKSHKERVTFKNTELRKMPIIIGRTWLEKHNLIINLRTGNISMT